MTINLNERVRVILTKRGKEIALQNGLRFRASSGLLVEQLWVLMKVFGKHFQMDSVMEFERNEIHSADPEWQAIYDGEIGLAAERNNEQKLRWLKEIQEAAQLAIASSPKTGKE